MKAVLRGVSGPGTGVQLSLDRGMGVSVGRNETCAVAVPGDTFLSGRHFELLVLDEQLLLRDPSSSNGTFVNGTRVREQALQDGDLIRAGQSVFQVELHVPELPTVLDVLSGQPEPVYAVVDAARDPAIYPLLLTSGAQYTCLYSGKLALKLEAVAPYLAYLPPGCELMQKVVAQGWAKSWGIFLTSSQPPQTVWHELRRSLMVTVEDTGQSVYFRFYDPRVLRVFLPIAEPAQRQDFSGTISSFLLEDEDGDALLRFHSLQGTPGMEKIAVRKAESRPAAKIPAAPVDATQMMRAVPS